jgi:acyl-CoA thioesterase FadM
MDYAVEAVEGWCEAVLGTSWAEMGRRGEHSVYFLQAGCEFFKTLTAGEVVLAQVELVGIDNSQMMFSVSGENAAAELCFRVRLTA